MSWASYAARIPLGRFSSVDGWSYRITMLDVPWAVRFVMGEKEGHADTEESWTLLWTMMNRLKLTWPIHRDYASMVIAYSVALHGEPTPRRARIQSLEPSDVPASVLARVETWLAGRVQPGVATGMVHFDQCGTASPEFGPADYTSPSGECYWKAAGSRSWGPTTMRAEPGSGSGGGIVGVVAGLLGIAGLVAAAERSSR